MYCSFVSRPHILASLSNNSPPPPPHINPKPPVHKISTATPATTSTAAAENNRLQRGKRQKRKQPSVAEIERAIGAGIYRDRDTTNRNSEQNKTLFDSILPNSEGMTEGSVEKKLRETGEWFVDRTQRKPRSNSAGKNILVAVFLSVPFWIVSFLVAAGFVKLPFSTPFLDDLMM